MLSRTRVGDLHVADVLHEFVNKEALPGTGIDAAACLQCNIVASGNAIDADPDNYTELVVPANIGTTAAYAVTDGAKVYPANTFAGFDIDNPNLIGAGALSGITISTTDQYGP